MKHIRFGKHFRWKRIYFEFKFSTNLWGEGTRADRVVEFDLLKLKRTTDETNGNKVYSMVLLPFVFLLGIQKKHD